MNQNGKVKDVAARLCGPVGSILLHLLVFALLFNYVLFTPPEKESDIDVQVVSEQQMELDEPEKKLEQPDSIEEADMSVESDLPLESEQMPETESESTEESSEPEILGVASSVESPVIMKGLFAGRTKSGRKSMLNEFAGDYAKQVEAAVLQALDWFKETQTEEGCWSAWESSSRTAQQESTRLTGLALMTFLAHGESPSSQDYGQTVQRALQYLLSKQNEYDEFCPIDKEKVGYHDDIGVYAHAIATYALCEAYSLTRAPVLKDPLRRAVRVIVAGQRESGSWDHRYQHAKWSDLSVSGWQIQALVAAEAAGIEVEGLDQALKKAVAAIESHSAGGGEFYYRMGIQSPVTYDYMTGVGVLSLQLLGEGNSDLVEDGVDYLRDCEVTDWQAGWEKTDKKVSFNIAYEWYYTTQAIFQEGGSSWRVWNREFAPMLINAQDKDGAWRPPSEKGLEISNDIINVTAYSALSLQVYYRILPTFKRVKAAPEPEAFDEEVVVEIL